jgi:hypothetical protein
MHVTNFVSKIDKKCTWRGQFHQLKNPRWLFCKIETQGGQFANDPNPGGDYAI